MPKKEPLSPRTAATQCSRRGAEVAEGVSPYCAIAALPEIPDYDSSRRQDALYQLRGCNA